MNKYFVQASFYVTAKNRMDAYGEARKSLAKMTPNKPDLANIERVAIEPETETDILTVNENQVNGEAQT